MKLNKQWQNTFIQSKESNLKPHNYQLCALPLSYFESLLNFPLREKLSSRFRITGAALSGFQ